MRARVLVALLVGLVAALAPPASAHEFGPDIRVRFDDLPPVLDDLTIEVVTSIAPQLAIGNPTDDELEVLADDGVPFLRIGPDGVEANFDSADFYLTQDPLGALAVPERARGDGDPPTWRRVATAPEWAWFDHRMHPQNVQRLRVPEPGDAGTVLSTFVVPVRFRGQQVDITGSIVQQPVTGRLVGALRRAPDVAGVDVTLLPGGTPGLFVTAEPDREVVVLGAAGEPFLRFADGVVEANVHSPSWYDSGRATRLDPDADEAAVIDAAAPPSWLRVSRAPRYGWVESRALYGRGRVDEDLDRSGVAQDLVDWQVPLLVDGERFEVVGVTRFEPFADTSDGDGWGPARIASVTLAGLGVVAILVVVLRRRQRSPAG